MFKKLIELTKHAEIAEQHYQSLIAPGALASADEINKALCAKHAAQEQLAHTASAAFAKANLGDDIEVVTGRCTGDDDDSVGVFFAGSAENPDSYDLFLLHCLNITPSDDKDDDKDAEYFIVTQSTLGEALGLPALD